MAARHQTDRLDKLRKQNDQLKREAGIQRIKISEAAKGCVLFGRLSFGFFLLALHFLLSFNCFLISQYHQILQ